MDVISQETALFAGTLRENLDPEGDGSEESDKKLKDILKNLDFQLDSEGLDAEVEAEGMNYSIGMRQLVCFARILVSKRKLVI